MARVLFLGGLGRSGTTLVERLLGELPGVCAARRGRPPLAARHPRRRALRLRRPVLGLRRSGSRSASAPSAAGTNVDVDRVHALRDAVERTRHIPRLATAGRGAGRGPRVRRATTPGSTRAAAEVSGARGRRRLVQALRARPRACAGADDIDLRVVHVVRDARGVAYSWTKTVTRPETDGARRDDPLLPRPLGAAVERAQRRVRPARPARRAGAPDPLRGVPGRPARPSCSSSPPSPASGWPPADLAFLRRTATPTCRSGTARPATRCASPSAGCRCAATTPGCSALPAAPAPAGRRGLRADAAARTATRSPVDAEEAR